MSEKVRHYADQSDYSMIYSKYSSVDYSRSQIQVLLQPTDPDDKLSKLYAELYMNRSQILITFATVYKRGLIIKTLQNKTNKKFNSF